MASTAPMVETDMMVMAALMVTMAQTETIVRKKRDATFPLQNKTG